MRKRLALLLLLKLSGLLPLKVLAQSQLSLEHYYAMSAGTPLTSMPIAGYQLSKGFYAEGRYNYEELNTFSFYMGRTFSKESKFSYAVSPIAGAVMGELNGGSVGANVSLGYKNFYIYSQPQYTFSVENAINNFIYSWTDITYSPRDWLSVGVSLQHTKPYQSKGFFENGLVVEAAFKKFSFPVYVFNPLNKDRSFVFGTTIEFSFKKKKSQQKDNPDPFKEPFPVKIAANAEEKKTGTPDKIHNSPQTQQIANKDQIKPASDEVAKIRRVSVMVFNKEKVAPAGDNATVKKQPVTSTKTAPVRSIPTPETPQVKSPAKVNKAEVKPVEKKAADAKTEPVKIAPPHPGYTVYYALLLGPFKSQEDATQSKLKLMSVFTRDIVMFSESSSYKLRVQGFEDEKAAEIYRMNLMNEGIKVSATITSYKQKNIDAVPLKDMQRPFEATQIINK